MKQCRFTAAGDAGDTGEETDRNVDVEVFEVVKGAIF